MPFSAGKKGVLMKITALFNNVEMFLVATNTELQDCKVNSFRSVSNFLQTLDRCF